MGYFLGNAQHEQCDRLAGGSKKRPRATRLKENFDSAVDGFIFPLQSEEDVDRLEWNVRQNQDIRDQYVAFLKNVKLFRQDLSNVFTDLFADEALLGYNYYGKTNRAKKKKAMKKYIIFTDCMLELHIRVRRMNLELDQSDLLPTEAVDYLEVSGFYFPIKSEDEVERLEADVREDIHTRRCFVQYLRDLKKPNIPIRRIFQSVFYDEALINYNYNGISNIPNVKKRAMKSYSIFRDCFLAAWQDFGITDIMIQNMLTEIIRNINRRRRNRQYQDRIRKNIIQRKRTTTLLITKQRGPNSKKWSDTAQTYQRYPTEFPVSLHEQESAVPGFRFPIETEADIERLEKTVRTCPETRRKYISFLQRMKQPESSIESIFKSVFYDEALSDYNYNGFCNSRRTKKRAMKTYAIFTSCLFEAWMMYGITATQIRNMLGKIVRNLHGRKRFRRYRDRVREQRNTENVIYLEGDSMFDVRLINLLIPHLLNMLPGDKRDKPSPALLFPLTEAKAVIKLEESVRTDPNARRKYIKFLKRIKSPRNSVVDTFYKICTDDAIFRHFNWTSQKAFHPHMQRESLQQYLIFTDCMVEAWSSHGITREDIKMNMASIVKRIYVRNNVRNFRAKSSHRKGMGKP